MGRAVDMARLADILSPWVGHEKIPDTVVLGCTHFPLIKEELQQILGEKVSFIDSGEAIGRRARRLVQDIETQDDVQVQKSRAYCTRLDERVSTLSETFTSYGFLSLKELNLSSDVDTRW